MSSLKGQVLLLSVISIPERTPLSRLRFPAEQPGFCRGLTGIRPVGVRSDAHCVLLGDGRTADLDLYLTPLKASGLFDSSSPFLLAGS
jgi:hypothetical protein